MSEREVLSVEADNEVGLIAIGTVPSVTGARDLTTDMIILRSSPAPVGQHSVLGVAGVVPFEGPVRAPLLVEAAM